MIQRALATCPKSHSNGEAEIQTQVYLSVKPTLYPEGLQPSGQAMSFDGQAVPGLRTCSNIELLTLPIFKCFSYRVKTMIINTSWAVSTKEYCIILAHSSQSVYCAIVHVVIIFHVLTSKPSALPKA